MISLKRECIQSCKVHFRSIQVTNYPDMTNVGEKYRCENSGGVVLVIEPGLPLTCCGQMMGRVNKDKKDNKEIKDGTVEAPKHIPIISEVDLY